MQGRGPFYPASSPCLSLHSLRLCVCVLCALRISVDVETAAVPLRRRPVFPNNNTYFSSCKAKESSISKYLSHSCVSCVCVPHCFCTDRSFNLLPPFSPQSPIFFPLSCAIAVCVRYLDVYFRTAPPLAFCSAPLAVAAAAAAAAEGESSFATAAIL